MLRELTQEEKGDGAILQKLSNQITRAVSRLRRQEKICIFIDNLSLFHALRFSGIKLDYLKLQEHIADGRTSDVRFYYTYHPDSDPTFFDFLENKAGFIMNAFEILDEDERANVNCEIVYDMVRLVGKYDKYVLVSGFTNYGRTVARLREDFGIRVEVAFLNEQIAPSLAMESDDIIDLADFPQIHSS